MTKSRTQAVLISKTKSRPDTLASKEQIGSAGPGHYDDGMRFNSNVKNVVIGEKRAERQIVDNRNYDHEKADAVTKHKMPNITMGSSPSRPKSLARGGDVDVAPGQYDDGKRWNSNVKPMTIGEKRTEKRTVDNRDYDYEKADAVTKSKMPNITMGSSPSRPKSLA